MTCESVLLWLVRQRIRVNWLKNWRSRFKTMTIFLHSYSTIWYSAGVVTSDIALTAIRILNFLALLNISVFKIRVTLREPNYRYGLVAVCSVRICTTHINACPWFQARVAYSPTTDRFVHASDVKHISAAGDDGCCDCCQYIGRPSWDQWTVYPLSTSKSASGLRHLVLHHIIILPFLCYAPAQLFQSSSSNLTRQSLNHL